MNSGTELGNAPALIVRQRKELAELFGYESRNKYEILAPDGRSLAFAAEQQKGVFGMIMRQLVGHWRTFDILFFTPDRQAFMRAHHPFRVFFPRLEVFDPSGVLVGALQGRFGILAKCFDIEDAAGNVLMTTRTPVWKPWTFLFRSGGREVATVKKRWSGLLTELVTDADNFSVEIGDPTLPAPTRMLLLVAAIFIDLRYFEEKAHRRRNDR